MIKKLFIILVLMNLFLPVLFCLENDAEVYFIEEDGINNNLFVKTGKIIQIPVKMTVYNQNVDLTGYELNVLYDPSVLTFMPELSTIENLWDYEGSERDGFVLPFTYESNVIKFGYYSLNKSETLKTGVYNIQEKIIGVLSFYVKQQIETEIGFIKANLMYGGAEGGNVDVSGVISLDKFSLINIYPETIGRFYFGENNVLNNNISGKIGNVVQIPVYLDSCLDGFIDVTSYEFIIKYDPLVLEFLPQNSTLENLWDFSLSQRNGYVLPIYENNSLIKCGAYSLPVSGTSGIGNRGVSGKEIGVLSFKILQETDTILSFYDSKILYGGVLGGNVSVDIINDDDCFKFIDFFNISNDLSVVIESNNEDQINIYEQKDSIITIEAYFENNYSDQSQLTAFEVELKYNPEFVQPDFSIYPGVSIWLNNPQRNGNSLTLITNQETNTVKFGCFSLPVSSTDGKGTIVNGKLLFSRIPFKILRESTSSIIFNYVKIISSDGGEENTILSELKPIKPFKLFVPLRGDVNLDHKVDVYDIMLAVSYWGLTNADFPKWIDFNKNDRIDVIDIMNIVKCWGN